jgi:hypothetical protein
MPVLMLLLLGLTYAVHIVIYFNSYGCIIYHIEWISCLEELSFSKGIVASRVGYKPV